MGNVSSQGGTNTIIYGVIARQAGTGFTTSATNIHTNLPMTTAINSYTSSMGQVFSCLTLNPITMSFNLTDSSNLVGNVTYQLWLYSGTANIVPV